MNVLNRKRLKEIRLQLTYRKVQLREHLKQSPSEISLDVIDAIQEEIYALRNEKNHIMRFGR